MNTHRRVRDAVKARLAAIVCGLEGRAYTPDAVVLYSVFPEAPLVESSFRTVYGLRPSSEIRRIGVPDPCFVTCDLTLALAAWRRLESADENPHGGAGPDRWDMVSDMVADIAQQIEQDFRFEEAASHILDHTIAIDYERFLPEWAVAELSFTVRYRYPRGQR